MMTIERALVFFLVGSVTLATGCDSDPSTNVDVEPIVAPEASVHPLAWRGIYARASGVGELEISTGEGWSALEPGATIAPGSSLRTGDRAIALITLEGEGALIMNKSTTLNLTLEKPGVKVERGHAIVETPEAEEAKRGAKPHIQTPTGGVVLTGTTVSVLADDAESVVTVAQGEARAAGAPTTTEELVARFGQELVLPSEGSPRVVGTPDLPETFGWGEVPGPNEELPSLERGMGKLMARSPLGGSERPLELRRHEIDVKIQGAMAYTEITEVFHNPTGAELEGTYRFPLPPGAQISRLALEVNGRMMEGQFIETARAERIWSQIINQWRDPALLKWKQGDQFELRIFPILPRSSRKVVIGYVQRLEESARGYRYAYPMPIDRSGQTRTGTLTFAATISGHPAEQPVRTQGYKGIEVTQRDGLADTATTDVRFERKDFSPSGDLQLEFAVDQEQRALRAWGYQNPKKASEDGWVAIALRPDFAPSVESGGRDFIVALDTSYGRQGVTMKLQAAALGAIVDGLSPLDRVRVIACASRCEGLGSLDFEHARSPLARALAQAAGGLEAAGSTYTVEAMRAASAIFAARAEKDRERSAHVIYMTDGVASAGALDPAPILEATKTLLEPSRAKLTVVDLGGGSDDATLNALARGGAGQVVTLTVGDTMRANALHILRHHYGASLRDLEVSLPPELEQVYPTTLEGTLAGDEVLLVARAKPGATINGEVTLTGTLAGAKWSAAYPLDLEIGSEAGDAFVPRLWGTHRIAELERTAGDHKREIVKLSQKYGVLTRYTTLLALESRDMENEFGVRRQNHIDWKGDDAPSDAEDAEDTDGFADATKTTTKRTARSRSGPRKPKAAPKLAKKKSSLDDLLGDVDPSPREAKNAPARDLDLDANVSSGTEKTAEARPRAEPVSMDEKPRRRSRPRGKGGYGWSCRYVSKHDVTPPRDATSSEVDRVERYRAKLDADATNRTTHMRYIRALMRADRGEEARQASEVWLEMNPMDPEAVAQRAQVALFEGDAEGALRWLEGAVDAAARARWIQQRVQRAHASLGDQALACAHEVSLEHISPKRGKAPTDVLSCPMASRPSALFTSSSPEPTRASAPPKRSRSSRGITVEASWVGDGDVDIVLIEPSGRPLSFLSQRRKVEVGGVLGGASERLHLRSLRKGTYTVRVVRRSGDAPLDVAVKLNVAGKRSTYDVTLEGDPVEVAEITTKSKRVCR